MAGNLCACGCGGRPKGLTSRFLPGHDSKLAAKQRGRAKSSATPGSTASGGMGAAEVIAPIILDVAGPVVKLAAERAALAAERAIVSAAQRASGAAAREISRRGEARAYRLEDAAARITAAIQDAEPMPWAKIVERAALEQFRAPKLPNLMGRVIGGVAEDERRACAAAKCPACGRLAHERRVLTNRTTAVSRVFAACPTCQMAVQF